MTSHSPRCPEGQRGILLQKGKARKTLPFLDWMYYNTKILTGFLMPKGEITMTIRFATEQDIPQKIGMELPL